MTISAVRRAGALVFVGAIALSACQAASGAPTAPTAPPTTTADPTTSAESPRQWRLMAVGDVLLDDTEAAGVDAFADVRPRLAEADLAIVNLETALAPAGVGAPADKQFAFRTPPSGARTLAKAGVDIASLANNHSLDYGPVALLEGINALREARVEPVGAGVNLEAANAIVSRTIKTVRVGVLAASRVTPSMTWMAGPNKAGVADGYAADALVARVRAAKTNHDVVAVVIHWGAELAPCPQADEVTLARRLRAAGATLVIGHHPHVLQPLVGDTTGAIAYSLGNFAFHRRGAPTGDSAVLDVVFDGATIKSLTLHPHTLSAGPPRPSDAAGAARVRQALRSSACGLS